MFHHVLLNGFQQVKIGVNAAQLPKLREPLLVIFDNVQEIFILKSVARYADACFEAMLVEVVPDFLFEDALGDLRISAPQNDLYGVG